MNIVLYSIIIIAIVLCGLVIIFFPLFTVQSNGECFLLPLFKKRRIVKREYLNGRIFYYVEVNGLLGIPFIYYKDSDFLETYDIEECRRYISGIEKKMEISKGFKTVKKTVMSR